MNELNNEIELNNKNELNSINKLNKLFQNRFSVYEMMITFQWLFQYTCQHMK